MALQAIRKIASGDSAETGAPTDMAKLSAFYTIGSPLRKFRQLFMSQSYKWSFAEFNERADRLIFIGEGREPHGHVPWFNFWYASDIFADRLAYIPIGELKRKLAAREPKAIKESDPADFDRTGYAVGPKRDIGLGFRIGVWTHSDYWLDRRFVDHLLRVTVSGSESSPSDRTAPDSSTVPSASEPTALSSEADTLA